MSDETDPREAFDEATKEAYNDQLKHGDEEGYANDIYDEDFVVYRVPKSLADRMRKYGCVPGPGCTTTCVVPQELGRILYLDVGRWGGGAPTSKRSADHWGRRRHFGLVHGKVAALCNYPAGSDGGKPPRLDKNVTKLVTKESDYKRLVPLLDHLSSDPTLGQLVVENALHADMPSKHSSGTVPTLAETPSRDVIQVFLGDLHLPVMDVQNMSRTYFGNTYKPPRRGRVDAIVLAALTSLAKDLAKSGVAWPLMVPGAVAQLLAMAHGMLELELLERWSDEDRLTTQSATEWLVHYTGDRSIGKQYATPPLAKVRGADIFDGAGADLGRWLDLLISYQQRAKEDATCPPLELVQLGDLFDFWMGLQRLSDDPSLFDVANQMDHALEFVKFWLDETLNHTFERASFRRLLGLSKKEIPTTFVRGNHDNYMFLQGHGHAFQAPGLMGEHGHATDQYNRDESYLEGWALTQAAYIVPDLRLIESPLIAYKNDLTGDLASRVLRAS